MKIHWQSCLFHLFGRTRGTCCKFTCTFILLMALPSLADRPNLLLIIADDASCDSFSAYGNKQLATPHLDQLASDGVRFLNTYCCNPRCSPARSCLLTGRYSWQLDEACNHSPFLTDRWRFFPNILREAGYFTGYTGKGWGPGVYHHVDTGRSNYTSPNPAGASFNLKKLSPPYSGISVTDYAGNFAEFLAQKPAAEPFCFWIGSREPHRPYEKGSGAKQFGDLSQIQIPGHLPDNEVVRSDFADYLVEVQWFDKQIGKVIELLNQRGLQDNTVVLVTSDNGMPFPRVKGDCYDESTRVPLVVQWKNHIEPNRVVTDFVSFPDLAPTLLELASVPVPDQMTGKSFTEQLLAKESGRVDATRNSTLIGRERHDVGTTDGDKRCVSYPVRGIRTDKYLLLRNFKPNRWPAGDPQYNFLGCDPGPTKAELLKILRQKGVEPFAKYCFDKRPDEELYDLSVDPNCLNNLAAEPRLTEEKNRLLIELENTLRQQGDPRVLGKGEIFDDYPNSNVYLQRKVYGDYLFDPVALFEAKHDTQIPVALDTYWGRWYRLVNFLFWFALLSSTVMLFLLIRSKFKRRRSFG